MKNSNVNKVVIYFLKFDLPRNFTAYYKKGVNKSRIN